MNKLGVLRCHYIIEKNEDLQQDIIDMVRLDNIAQWLTGDELKQDQFKFLYNTLDIIYQSPLKQSMIIDSAEVRDTVIPMLVTFKSLLNILRINQKKAFDA